jgi:hypothetical protein
MKNIITIDRNRFREEIAPYIDKYGQIDISITRLDIALERSEVAE